jgi:hypothetical protein
MTDHDETAREPGDGDHFAARDTEHDIQAAFASLRNDTRKVDTMAALRQLEGRRRWVVPVALGGAVAAVLLLLGLAVFGGGDDTDQNVATIDDGDAADGQAPAEGNGEVADDELAQGEGDGSASPEEGAGEAGGSGDDGGGVEPDPDPAPDPEDQPEPEPEPEPEPDPDPDPDPEQETVEVLLEGDGLGFVEPDSGSISRLPFGSPAGQVLDVLDRLLGEGERSPSSPECPNQADRSVLWSDAGLQVELRGGELISWSLRPNSGLSTLTGIGIGSTRAELEEAYVVELVDSTLGVEFTTGDDPGTPDAIRGLLSGRGNRATVTDLWAGEICAFR